MGNRARLARLVDGQARHAWHVWSTVKLGTPGTPGRRSSSARLAHLVDGQSRHAWRTMPRAYAGRVFQADHTPAAPGRPGASYFTRPAVTDLAGLLRGSSLIPNFVKIGQSKSELPGTSSTSRDSDENHDRPTETQVLVVTL